MLKSRILLKASIATSALLIITTTLALSLFVQPGSATIVIDAALPDVPSEMYVLEAQSKAISSEQATYIASAIFNVTGEPTLANGSWTIKKNRLEVSIYETGSITFFDIAKMWDAGYTLAKPLPETEYKVIVEQLLEKLPAQGIWQKIELPPDIQGDVKGFDMAGKGALPGQGDV